MLTKKLFCQLYISVLVDLILNSNYYHRKTKFGEDIMSAYRSSIGVIVYE